jgi:hypothetical protein
MKSGRDSEAKARNAHEGRNNRAVWSAVPSAGCIPRSHAASGVVAFASPAADGERGAEHRQ